MSKPPIDPETTLAGIALDPRTLERVIPESRRSDGSVRKQIKIRPGYTPQEDVRRFRGTRQAQMDTNVLPKGHIIGWTPPPQAAAASTASTAGMSKAQKKNAKRKESRKKREDVKANWDDDDEGEGEDRDEEEVKEKAEEQGKATGKSDGGHTVDKPNWAAAPNATTKGKSKDAKDATEELTDKLDKLEVR